MDGKTGKRSVMGLKGSQLPLVAGPGVEHAILAACGNDLPVRGDGGQRCTGPCELADLLAVGEVGDANSLVGAGGVDLIAVSAQDDGSDCIAVRGGQGPCWRWRHLPELEDAAFVRSECGIAVAAERQRRHGTGVSTKHCHSLAILRVPEAQGLVCPAGDEKLATGAKGYAHYRSVMSLDAQLLLGVGSVPDLHQSILAARGQLRPVGIERDRLHGIGVVNGANGLAAGEVPDPGSV